MNPLRQGSEPATSLLESPSNFVVPPFRFEKSKTKKKNYECTEHSTSMVGTEDVLTVYGKDCRLRKIGVEINDSGYYVFSPVVSGTADFDSISVLYIPYRTTTNPPFNDSVIKRHVEVLRDWWSNH